MIRKNLEQAGLIRKFPLMRISTILGLRPGTDIVKPSNILSDTSFADDCVFPVFAVAFELVDVASKVMSIIYCAFAQHGLTLNMQKGKTALMLHFKGPGAHTAKLAFQNSGKDGLYFKGINGEKVFLNEEHEYKQVGRTIVSAHTQHPQRFPFPAL